MNCLLLIYSKTDLFCNHLNNWEFFQTRSNIRADLDLTIDPYGQKFHTLLGCGRFFKIFLHLKISCTLLTRNSNQGSIVHRSYLQRNEAKHKYILVSDLIWFFFALTKLTNYFCKILWNSYLLLSIVILFYSNDLVSQIRDPIDFL